ncbi:MAG: Gfo/Idh/MocA family oxidoreductase [Acidobacteria bacterium]|nr:Gfo/Idh/MocA family oxidoreductase [Acidobacteriota bacterium]
MKQVPRRAFLKDALTGSAALAAAATSARKVHAAPNDQINVASVGVGGMGTAHVERLLTRQDVRVAAICDIDQAHRERAEQMVKRARNYTPRSVEDFRRLLDDPSIDALVIATPHHWHCPIAIPAMQAGKDVYVEKPASHVFREGRLLIDAAKKYNRIVQHGTQMRSSEVTKKADELLKGGVIGAVKMSKAWNCQHHNHRQPISNAQAPAGVNYDMWLGPAAKLDFNQNRFHGNWAWYRDYGNGDIGNDGIHDLDLARWGLGVTTHPNRITAHGSRIDLTGEREYPDNMMVSYHYDEGKVLTYEDRGWTPYGNYGFDSGNAFYGTEGYMIFSRRGYFQVYLGKKDEKGPGMSGGPGGHPEHMYDFIDCVRSRKQPVAHAEVAHLSCGLTHLGEIAYRVRRVLEFDPQREKFIGDAEADKMLTKEYREPWSVPDPV